MILSNKHINFSHKLTTLLTNMSSLNLKTEDPDDEICVKTLHILQDFLQPSSRLTVQSAAQSILKLLPGNDPYSIEVMEFGGTCIEVAEQIPYHHPSQIKLADLIEELGDYPAFVTRFEAEVCTI